MLLDEDEIPEENSGPAQPSYHFYFWVAIILIGSYADRVHLLHLFRWIGFGGVSGYIFYNLLFVRQHITMKLIKGLLLIGIVVFINLNLLGNLVFTIRNGLFLLTFAAGFLFYRYGHKWKRSATD